MAGYINSWGSESVCLSVCLYLYYLKDKLDTFRKVCSTHDKSYDNAFFVQRKIEKFA
ncbi:unnamed protein product [Arctogadus glacialis]